MYHHLVNGKALPGGKYAYVAPDAAGKLHNSLNWVWWILEILPKSVRWRQRKRPSLFGWYFPWGEPRKLTEDLQIHSSVTERRGRVASYRPINLIDR
jgi:hypothetical protein